MPGRDGWRNEEEEKDAGRGRMAEEKQEIIGRDEKLFITSRDVHR